MRSHVLLVCYGGGHAAILAAVARSLNERKSLEFSILALTTARQVFEKYGLPTLGYRDFMGSADPSAHKFGELLAADVNGSAAGISSEETVAYMGQCMSDLVAECGEEEAWRRYRQIGRHAFAPTRTMRRILDQMSPNIVVATNSPKSERAAIEAARDAGIRSVMIPDLFCEPGWEIYHPLRADHFFVMSSLARQNLIEHHAVRENGIVITGQPAFDKSSVPDKEECKEYVEKLGGPRSREQFFVIATSEDVPDQQFPAAGSADSTASLAVIMRSLSTMQSTHVIAIKPHPNEAPELYSSITAGRIDVHLLPPKAEINRVLRAADLLIAASPTTAVVDALALGVPTVACAIRRPCMKEILPRALGVPVFRSEDEVDEFLRNPDALARLITSQKDVRTELSRTCTGAADRIVTELEKLHFASAK